MSIHDRHAPQAPSAFVLPPSRLRGLAASAALALIVLGGCASAPERPAPAQLLRIGQTVQGQLAPGAEQRWQLDALQVPAGSVVRAEVDGRGVQLDLQDAAGQHLRRLLRSDGVGEGITWQAQAGEQLLLHWNAQPAVAYASSSAEAGQLPAQAAAGHYRLEIQRAWAPRAGPPVALPNKPLQSPRLQALAHDLERGGTTDAFWQEMAQRGTPLVEPWSGQERLVTFLWRGAQHSVRLFGSPSGNHESLQRLGRSDVWWSSFVMPSDARLSYGMAPDVPGIEGTATEQRRSILATLQRDPLNPRSWAASEDGAAAVDPYQGRSVLQLPDAPAQPWSQPANGPLPGDLQRHWLHPAALGHGRDVWTYRPAGWAQTPQDQRALLVLFDAHAYLRQVPTPQIVERLQAQGLIPATAVVLVANASSELRNTELPPNPAFADFMGLQLMPWLATQGLDVPAARTVIAGSSYGGLASSYMALRHPERFGNVLSLSGSYWWAPEAEAPNAMARWWAAAPRQNVRFYLDAGRYESARGGQAGILETSRELGDVLRTQGYPVTQREHSTGHDYVHWQGALACGLVALLNPAALSTLQAECKGR